MPVVMRGAPSPPKKSPAASTPDEHCAVLGVTIRDLGLEPWDRAKLDVFYKRAAAVAHPDMGGSVDAFQALQASYKALTDMALFQQWGTSSSTYGSVSSTKEVSAYGSMSTYGSHEKITYNGRTDAFGSPYKADVPTPPKATI